LVRLTPRRAAPFAGLTARAAISSIFDLQRFPWHGSAGSWDL